MVKGNGIYESKIENMNPNLRLVERVDVYDTGEETWGIKDLAGNRTPLFEILMKMLVYLLDNLWVKRSYIV